MESNNNLIPEWVINEQQAIDMIYNGYDVYNAAFLPGDDTARYQQIFHELDLPEIHFYNNNIGDNTAWLIPVEYQQLDIINWVIEKVPNDLVYQERAALELSLYQSRKLLPILRLMVYIVDMMKQSNAVWGVGRGSAVSSYVLYLIGVHSIDPIKYNLSINEFLR